MANLTYAQLQEKADLMRARPTSSEARAMQSLSAAGIAFESQVVFGFYIFDFVIPSKLLVVEIDGDSHKTGNKHDASRDEFTGTFGMEVLRIPNAEAHIAAELIAGIPDVENYADRWARILRKSGRVRERHDFVRSPDRRAALAARAVMGAAGRQQEKEAKAAIRAEKKAAKRQAGEARHAEKMQARNSPERLARIARNAALRKIGQHPEQVRRMNAYLAAAPIVPTG